MDAKDEIKSRLSVEDVVGDYLELKRAGSNLKAKSPFTNEKTASFMVSPQKQIWHDFSSNKGGDIFSFIMEIEGVDFKEALKILAAKANVELKQFKGDGKLAKQKALLHEAVGMSVEFYQKKLVANKNALDYVVNKRDYKRKVITDFKIGYSPGDGDALIKHLTKKGIERRTIRDAGLAVERSGQLVDMFRNRIMVPLNDDKGNPIGFTARVLDDSLPKYINTPQTLIYDKSRHLFGFHLAKEHIRQKGYVVVVEGNMDVIASHKAGVGNVVASAGTALTKQHLQMLTRFTDDVRLAFDSDRAGVTATERTIPLAQELGVNLSIISLGEGKDPDDLIKKDPKLWHQVIEKNTYSIDWLIAKHRENFDLSKVADKKRFSESVLKVIEKISDPVEVDHYLGKIAKISGVDKSAMKSKLGRISSPKRFKKVKYQAKDEPVKQRTYVDLLLGLNLIYPEVRQSLDKVNEKLLDDKTRKIIEHIKANPDERITKTPKSLHEIDDYVKIILFKTEELYGEWSSSDLLFEAIGLSRRLAKESQNKIKQTLTDKIKQAEEIGDDNLRNKYLQQFNELLKEN